MIEVIKPNNDVIPLYQKDPLWYMEKGQQSWDLLGNDTVSITVISTVPIEFSIRDRIVAYGRTYEMNLMPALTRTGNNRYSYDLVFEGPQYALRRAVFFNTDVTGFNTTSEFSLTGNAELFLDVILNNLERVFPGVWLKGEFPDTAAKTDSFNGQNTLDVLQRVCKLFETEFDIVQGSGTRTLHLRKVGQILGDTYQYGRGKGLYELKRNIVNEQDVGTRFWGFGGKQNLRSNYRNYSQRLMFEGGYIDFPDAIAAFGIREKQITFDDIYPRRTGQVTTVNGVASFRDSTMNFDLNETDVGGNTKWILNGVQPKISFKSGNLAGYDFLLQKTAGYVDATKTFNIVPFKDERGLELPNPDEAAFQIQVGDEYTILDIVLPTSYETTAEADLHNKTEQYGEQNCYPKVQYGLQVDASFLKTEAGGGSIVNFFGIGDYLNILDPELNIDKASRVIGMKRSLMPTEEYKYELTIDDAYTTVEIVEIINKIKDTDIVIKINDLRDPARARAAWRNILELENMVFDTDGYFDGGKIKPESITTLMLVVGAKSQQFILQDVFFRPNFEGNKNVVTVTEGLLIHYALKDEVVTWHIDASTHTIPDDGPRYIYAKVSKTDYDVGDIIFSTDQILPDSDPTYYHFLVGTLHSVIDGVRDISLTYGATAVNGRTIQTGVIRSSGGGSTFFDIDLGVIGGYIKFIDAFGNYRDLSDIGAATDRFYAVSVVNPLASYVYGKITAWFQSTLPDTWPSGDDPEHEGDMWYESDTNTVKRFVSGSWVNLSDPATLIEYIKQYTIRGNNSKVFLFTDTPVSPYKDGDLWMSPEGLRRSVATKITGQPFDINNWVEPFNFDNTATAIDGGIITSGTIQLAGDKNAVWAGITGQGTSMGSVRFWAGASYLNRFTAPVRIYQSGQIVGRTKIAVEGLNGSGEYVEQAGMAGSVTEGDEGKRFWAGATYEDRAIAPFNVDGRGYLWAQKGQIGNMQIRSGSLTNQDEDNNFTGEAAVILRNDVEDKFVGIGTNLLPAGTGATALMRVENNTVVEGENNYGAIFKASGATPDPALFGVGGMNFAIYADRGDTLLGGLLVNGQKRKAQSNSGGSLVFIDPTKYNYVSYISLGNNSFITFVKESFNTYPGSPGGADYEFPLNDGCEITLICTTDAFDVKLYRTVRPVGSSSVTLKGGSVTKLIFDNGAWYIKSYFDNNY